jgi:sugar O-acyltransferase (sialic acid O-acetyltransferase NeuD family)
LKKAIVWGSSGHAKVLRPIIEKSAFRIVAMIDRDPAAVSIIPGCPVFHSLEDLLQASLWEQRENISFAVAIGGDRGKDRIDIHRKLVSRGFLPMKLVHAKAWVADTVQLGDGAQVLGMAAISEEARIGRQTIVNTNASIDHECVIGEGCHVMPGATVAGCVVVGDFCTIGSNATVFPRVRIGACAVVGAGSVVIQNIPENAVAIGVPARLRRTNIEPCTG